MGCEERFGGRHEEEVASQSVTSSTVEPRKGSTSCLLLLFAYLNILLLVLVNSYSAESRLLRVITACLPPRSQLFHLFLPPDGKLLILDPYRLPVIATTDFFFFFCCFSFIQEVLTTSTVFLQLWLALLTYVKEMSFVWLISNHSVRGMPGCITSLIRWEKYNYWCKSFPT